MLKVKINLKEKSVHNVIKIKEEQKEIEIPKEKLSFVEVKKVIDYEDIYEEDSLYLSAKIEVVQKKIPLKAKVNYAPPKIKILPIVNLEEEDSSETETPEDGWDTPNSDSSETETVAINKIVKVNTKTPVLVKLNLKKTETNHVVYKSQFLDQVPMKKHNVDKPVFTYPVHLETYYDDATMYFIHQESGYLFPTNSNLAEILPQPIGKLIWEEWNQEEDFKDDEKYPLIKRKIEWFEQYELDAEMLA